MDLSEGEYTSIAYDAEKERYFFALNGEEIMIPEKYYAYLQTCDSAEYFYNDMLLKGFLPQQARELLPLGLKTEIVMTGFEDDWRTFINLRKDSGAHPDIQIIAKDIEDLFHETK